MPDQKLSTPSLGVCYYPEHWDETRWPADLQRMGSLGIRYVRVAEFAWSRFEPEPERFEFSWLQRFLDLARKEGLAVVVVPLALVRIRQDLVRRLHLGKQLGRPLDILVVVAVRVQF